jgi:hypothetical protein
VFKISLFPASIREVARDLSEKAQEDAGRTPDDWTSCLDVAVAVNLLCVERRSSTGVLGPSQRAGLETGAPN